MRYIENDRSPVNFRSGREPAYGMHKGVLLAPPVLCLFRKSHLCIQENEDVTTCVRIQKIREVEAFICQVSVVSVLID